MTIDEKLDKIVSLIQTMIVPVTMSLKEIKASYHSRVLLLIIQGILAIVVSFISMYAVSEITKITKDLDQAKQELATTIAAQAINKVDAALIDQQLKDLMDVMKETSRSKEMVKKIEKVEQIDSKQIQRAASAPPKTMMILDAIQKEAAMAAPASAIP